MVSVNITGFKLSKEDNTFLAISLIPHPGLIRISKQGFLAEIQKGVVLKKCYQKL